MRELTKSFGSFGWAMSLFGLKRLAEMMMPRADDGAPPDLRPGAPGPQGDAFDQMTAAAREHLGDGGFHEIFRSGDQIFRGLIDMLFGGGCGDRPPGWNGGDPRPGFRPGGAPTPHPPWESPPGRGPQQGPQSPPRPAPSTGWGPMPADVSPAPAPGAGASQAAGGWGPMPAASAPDAQTAKSAAAPEADAAGARGWGPMPPVPPAGAPQP